MEFTSFFIQLLFKKCDCKCFKWKTCQIVTLLTLKCQFHKFFNVVFGGFLKILSKLRYIGKCGHSAISVQCVAQRAQLVPSDSSTCWVLSLGCCLCSVYCPEACRHVRPSQLRQPLLLLPPAWPTRVLDTAISGDDIFYGWINKGGSLWILIQSPSNLP